MLLGMGIGAAGGLTSTIGGVLGSRARSKALKKALEKQQAALSKLKAIDINAYKTAAKQGDIAQLTNRYEAFRQMDPDLAKVRDASVQQMLNVMTGRQPELAAEYNKALTAEAMNFANAPEYKNLTQSFLQRAQQKMDLGATLPPEYQAELIRSGLEAGGVSGIGANRRGPLGQLLGRATGSAQLALEAQREQQAQQLLGTALNAQANRSQILQGLLPQVMGQPQLAQAGSMFQLAQSLVPGQVGLTGQDIVNAMEANRQFENQRLQALAGLSAQQSLRKGESQAGLWEAAGNSINNIMQGAMGGMGGGMGGGTPQMGNNTLSPVQLQSLLAGTQGASNMSPLGLW